MKQQTLAMAADQGFEQYRKPTRRDQFLEARSPKRQSDAQNALDGAQDRGDATVPHARESRA